MLNLSITTMTNDTLQFLVTLSIHILAIVPILFLSMSILNLYTDFDKHHIFKDYFFKWFSSAWNGCC